MGFFGIKLTKAQLAIPDAAGIQRKPQLTRTASRQGLARCWALARPQQLPLAQSLFHPV